MLRLSPWTLGARLHDDSVEFVLGDGRRLAWRARRPAAAVLQATAAHSVTDVLGPALAAHLAQSEPRLLVVQYEAALDTVDWEHLALGAGRLAEHFVLSRQLLSDADSEAPPPAPLADELCAVGWPVGGSAGATAGPDTAAAAALELPSAAGFTTAHVVVMPAQALGAWLQHDPQPPWQRLLVVRGTPPTAALAAALDSGAAVLVLEVAGGPRDSPLEMLLQQLAGGAAVGDAVRALQRRSSALQQAPRLYGEPLLRFVRAQPPQSRRQITSLSFDLVGSTTVLQRLGDEDYAEMLDRLHARCTEVVRRLGGQPDDPQGDDGVMCYFGHPTALEDAAERAVHAALQIVQTVADLGVSVRVGVATGLVAIKAGQPVGLSIHLAARLQQAAQPGTVLVSAATHKLVQAAFEMKPLAARPSLKGIDELGDLHRVLRPAHEGTRQRQEHQARQTPLIGRQAETARLQAGWQQACEGLIQLTVVRGDAGMGKSRLVRHFRQALVQQGVKVLECRCRADASASPYLTLAEALRRWLDIGPRTTPEQALAKLVAALPDAGNQPDALPVLAAFLGLAAPPAAPSGGLRQRLLALLLHWFVVFAADRPCCLVVEDWHWVDPSMREFIEHLARRGRGPGLLVVVTIRGNGMPAPAGFEHSQLIELAGLGDDEARELVGQVCAGAALPAWLLRSLALRGDGVPLFLEEAARMALELRAQGPDAALGSEHGVPSSLHDLLMARLDGLGAAKLVAQVAAVLGREFSLELLTELMTSGPYALDADTLAERLQTLVQSGLVSAEARGQYAFRHALIRDAAYGSLWARDRHWLHARVVELLRQQQHGGAGPPPELLALHLTEAGLHAEALAQWELAASNAAARSAELEAISHLRRALAVLARIEAGPAQARTALRLQLLLAARLIATEGYGADTVRVAYEEAERLADQLGDESVRFKVEMGQEAYRFMRADFPPALEHGRRAATIASRTGDIKQKLHAHWGLACTLFHQGQLRATMREMEAALAAYTPRLHALFGIQDPGVMCMAYSSWGLWELARPDAALARINQAVALADGFQHKFSQAVALAYGVSIELLRGEFDAAGLRAERCIAVCDDAGFPVWLAITRCMRGRVLCERGHYEEGLQEMRAGYAQWLATGAMVSQPLYLALQAEGLMLAGDATAAQACVDQGLAITERYGERQLQAELCRLAGELALQRGDTPQAEQRLKQAYALALRQHRLGFALRAATSLARLWAGQGRGPRAHRLLAPLRARWQEGLGTRDVQAATRLCAELAVGLPNDARHPPRLEPEDRREHTRHQNHDNHPPHRGSRERT